jgi:ABC-2 type transport system ATP-binding protein
MWNFLIDTNKQGTTIVLTTHYLEEAENLCKNVAIIDKGNIIENTSVRSLISKLDIETFIFDLKVPRTTPPKINNYVCHMLDQSTLQIDISKQQGLNNIFKQLSAQDIEIISMRNKSNRLEELFISLLKNNITDK